MVRQMKIAHTCIVTPHRAGIYETVRDLCAAERKLGANAIIVDPKQPTVDRGVPIGNTPAPHNFDVIINHSGLGEWEKQIEAANGSIPLKIVCYSYFHSAQALRKDCSI